MLPNDLALDIEHFGLEWIILEHCIFGVDANREAFAGLIMENRIDWGRLLDHAFRQKIVPMLVQRLVDLHLFRYCPSYLQSYLRLLLDYNKIKTEVYRKETRRIAMRFSESGIRYVCTKGIVLESSLYESAGYRSLSDIDFIVSPKDKNNVVSLLDGLGYVMGVYDWESRSPKEYSREQYLKYVITGNKIPNHFIVLHEGILPCVYTGFDMSLGWTGFPYEVDVETALSHTSTFSFMGDDVPISCFDCCYHYMYVILHLIKHAWSEYLQLTENDCNLSQFCDVIRYWERYQSELKSDFNRVVQEHDVLQPVLWVLEHTDRTFGTKIVEELSLKDKVDEEWLQTTVSKTGHKRLLRVSMREKLRLSDKNQVYLVLQRHKASK